MPQLLSIGSRGPTVTALQTKLNSRPPTIYPPLDADGIFGQMTSSRVREFQKNTGLPSDGIVGPMTWGALDAAAPEVPVEIPERTGIDCGNSDPGNRSLGMLVQLRYVNELKAAAKSGNFKNGHGNSFAHRFNFGLPSVNLPSFKPLTAAQQATAKGVYGSSLDFSKIFLSDQAGLQNRPFTTYVSIGTTVSLLSGLPVGDVQIMNCGTFTPNTSTLIHELAHVWQSQHSTAKSAFMINAVASQGLALALNNKEANPGHSSYPVNYPHSAYAYIAGGAFSSYGAEQIATQVEKGVTAIVSHVAGVAINAIDSDNDKSLLTPRTEDRRSANVVF